MMQPMETDYHNPVLLHECIEGLNINPKGTYVDVTYGGGGHSAAILEKLTIGKLIAFDRDIDAQANIPSNPAFLLIHQDYSHLKNHIRHQGFKQVDGILADLGISSHQVDTPERGFSFRFDAPLDMRMDNQIPKTAADILNDNNVSTLQKIFSEYGEVKNANTLARAITSRRKIEPIETTFQFLKILESVMPAKENIKKYAAPIFQALRIAVNDELNALKSFLQQAYEVLKPGGRLVVITYHSLEDRIVKNFFNQENETDPNAAIIYGRADEKWALINRKPIVPTDNEINLNPRARSAKLRIAEKK
jgi:16S rRNA (cytosine1402-N4)-methyltransferase